METLFKPGDEVVLRTDLSAGIFYPMLEKKEIDGEIYYLPSSNLVTAKAASWKMIDWINKRSFKTETIEAVVDGTYRLLCCYYHPNNWTDSMFDVIASKKLQEENRKRKELDSRFDVGDVVYLDVLKCEADQFEHFIRDVYGRYFGKYYVISKKYDNPKCTSYQLKDIVYNNDGPVVEGRYLLKADEATAKMLTRKQITITYNEKTRETIARLYVGLEIALSAHARRHKDDENNFFEGAERALRRLWKKMEEKGYIMILTNEGLQNA